MFKLEFETDNAAFDEDVFSAMSEIVEDVARDLGQRNAQGIIRDVNGNSIGQWEYIP